MCLEMSNTICFFSSPRSRPCSWLLVDELEMRKSRSLCADWESWASGALRKRKPVTYHANVSFKACPIQQFVYIVGLISKYILTPRKANSVTHTVGLWFCRGSMRLGASCMVCRGRGDTQYCFHSGGTWCTQCTNALQFGIILLKSCVCWLGNGES